ncbi:hypothetical protein SAMN04488122_4350 [Chitinophaga arvensicola]|uniref:Uncharacterized protein n=1 Tax=Chitinophaga arvensicola TaxID=29529 RepID=A0A1I0S763_9BACT|nr:hypothetical protein SAMN04488122_4350 [Chitinophaga arvensicola]
MKWFKIAMLVSARLLGYLEYYTKSNSVVYFYANKSDGYIKLLGMSEPNSIN